MKRSSWILYVVFYTVFANFPFWLATCITGLVARGCFCIDYVVVGIISLYLSRTASAVLLGIAIALDLVCGVGQTYFLPPAEIVSDSSALLQFPAMRIANIVAIALFAFVVASLSRILPRDHGFGRARTALALALFLMVCMATDFARAVAGTGQALNPIRALTDADAVNVARYQQARLARIPSRWVISSERFYLQVRRAGKNSSTQVLATQSAAEIGLNASGILPGAENQLPDLVVIMVESWGLSNDSAIRDSLVETYSGSGVSAKYQVLQGSVPFSGPTVSGEARELCGSTEGFHILDASPSELQKCFPDQLKAKGYHTIAVHGMDGHLFHRNRWYPKIGFDEQWFRDRFQAQNLPNCPGAFLGTCDAAIANWIGKRLREPEVNPRFVYWMTLNSHLPVPNPPLLPGPATCSFSSSLSSQPAFCAWYQLIANVHTAVSSLALGPLFRPTVFVVVGDHEPPFANQALRDKFSDAVVPYVILVPRTISPRRVISTR